MNIRKSARRGIRKSANRVRLILVATLVGGNLYPPVQQPRFGYDGTRVGSIILSSMSRNLEKGVGKNNFRDLFFAKPNVRYNQWSSSKVSFPW